MNYYKRNEVEVRDVLDLIYKFFGDDITPIESGIIFNIVKYLMRYKFKGQALDDLEKLKTYVDWLKEEEFK